MVQIRVDLLCCDINLRMHLPERDITQITIHQEHTSFAPRLDLRSLNRLFVMYIWDRENNMLNIELPQS